MEAFQRNDSATISVLAEQQIFRRDAAMYDASLLERAKRTAKYLRAALHFGLSKEGCATVTEVDFEITEVRL